MPFKNGHDKIGGRTSGVQNKTTTAFKELLMATYDALEKDPKTNMLTLAKANQTEFYRIASKLLPIQVQADIVQHKQIIFKEIGGGGNRSNGTLPKESGLNGSSDS